MHQAAIHDYFADKEPLLIDAICRLVRIDSTMGEPEPGKPFGPGPAAALEAFLALAAEWGLPGENLEGYVGTVDFNTEETQLHILGHMDIVPPGEGWTVTSSFAPVVKDGILYGRGVSDDKGPMAAALLAMKAVKDLQIPLKKNVRLIAGTDEETGFRDINWYYASHPYAPCTISPDADFPIINIEKGHYQPTLASTWPEETALPRVCAFAGGPRVNMIPPKATATVLGLSPEAIEAAAHSLHFEAPIAFTCTQAEEGTSILCSGLAAHGSPPEEGHNAMTALLALLAALPLADCPSTRALQALTSLFPHGDHRGQALGIAQEDTLSGPLTLAFTMLTLNDAGCQGRFDSRTPLCGTEESILQVAEEKLTRAGFTVTGKLDAPHHVPEDSPFLQILARCYEQYTGQKSQCIAIGGGTYVHDIPGGVAFGPNMPGFASNIHGPDECACVADLITAAKIYTQMIIDLCS